MKLTKIAAATVLSGMIATGAIAQSAEPLKPQVSQSSIYDQASSALIDGESLIMLLALLFALLAISNGGGGHHYHEY